MCGINGLVKKSVSQDLLINTVKRMNLQTSYRGPDNSNAYLNNNTCLGHNRLSIIDLSSSANQPFKFSKLRLVFNGEIYNYKKIRTELINLGYVFKTSSDTEVVILSFDCWGVDCFEKFEGMFAVCLLDVKSNYLYLVRDFFGEKPLYYNYKEGSDLVFSSEINSVRDVVKSFSSTKLDKKIIPHYLKYLYLPSDRSPYENIYSLKKGHYIKINLDTIKLEEYKSYIKKKENFQNVNINTLKENLINSIGDQLEADVDIGLWLSGGIDSSLIAAIASKEFNIKLNTFTVKFPKELSYNNEYKIAQNVAKIFNHPITYLDIDYQIDNDLIENVITKQENLIANPSAILHELLCEKTSSYSAKVILNGLGGDEFFGGYNRYKAFSFHNNLKKLKYVKKYLSFFLNKISKSRNSPVGNLNRSLLKLLDSYNDNETFFYDNIISYKSDRSIRKFNNKLDLNDPYNDLMKFDIDNYMLNDLLFLSDKFSMSHSFELRSPFLNKNLYNNSFSMSSSLRMGKPGNKQALFDWLYDYSSGKYKKQRKKGFTMSVEPYLKSINKKDMLTIFKKTELFDIINKEYLICNLNNFYNGSDNINNIYSLYYLSKWRIINNE